MAILVVSYSLSGNNARLGRALAARLDAAWCEVIEPRPRPMRRTLLDLGLRRAPRVEPLRHDPADFSYVVFTAPVWNAQLASPLRTVLARHRDRLPPYAFVSLAGFARPWQDARLRRELATRTGRLPDLLRVLHVADLLPATDRWKPWVVWRHRVTDVELGRLAPELDAIAAHIATASHASPPA